MFSIVFCFKGHFVLAIINHRTFSIHCELLLKVVYNRLSGETPDIVGIQGLAMVILTSLPCIDRCWIAVICRMKGLSLLLNFGIWIGYSFTRDATWHEIAFKMFNEHREKQTHLWPIKCYTRTIISRLQCL